MRPCCITATSCRDLRRNAQIVGDEQQRDAEAGLDFIEQFQHLRLHGDVQRRNRFIRHQYVGIERQRTRNGDALSLAAGELVRIAGDGIDGEIDQFEQIARFRQRVGVRHAVIDGSFGDGLADADARIKRTIGILKNDLDSLAVRLQRPARQIGDFSPGKPDAAGGRIDQPDDAARHRRFAGPAFADDAQRAALAQAQRDILGGRYFADATEEGVLAIDLAELVGLENYGFDRFTRGVRGTRLGTAESRLRVYSMVGLRRMVPSVPVSTSCP